MPRMDVATRKRVIVLHRAGYTLGTIWKRLQQERIKVTLRSLQRLLKKFKKHHIITDLPRQHKSRKITANMSKMIDSMLQDNDELTARQIREKLEKKFPSLRVSLATVKRSRRENGWVCTRPHYCQLIREANKAKRVAWCKKQLENCEQFEDVIFSDECTVQLDHHGRLCFRKQNQKRILKQRPKHPAKVHIWGGISVRGATQIVIFTGIMNAVKYVQLHSCR